MDPSLLHDFAKRLKARHARAVQGRTKLHVEPVTYTGSCDARSQVTWLNGRGVPIQHVPAKLTELPKPYCYPILTEAFQSSNGGKGCFRWVYLIGRPASDESFRRHYGGTSLNTNGVNWSFADGHVQWLSAAAARDQLVCCIGYKNSLMRGNEATRIDSHCKRN